MYVSVWRFISAQGMHISFNVMRLDCDELPVGYGQNVGYRCTRMSCSRPFLIFLSWVGFWSGLVKRRTDLVVTR